MENNKEEEKWDCYDASIRNFIIWRVGIVLMLASIYVFDLIVPYNFNRELKEKNVAAGFLIAGIFISVAIIIRTVII